MAPLLLLLLFLPTISSAPSTPHSQSSEEEAFISAIISESGLEFVKDLLIEQAVNSLIPIRLPDVEEAIRVPFIGGVRMAATNITLLGINVSSSVVKPGESGIAIVASGATVNLSMDWRYSYSTWILPIEISDHGTASIQVEGMEVGLTMSMKNKNGTLQLTAMECGCYMDELIITLNGGASWFYQGFVDALGNQIRSAVENTITNKISEGTLQNHLCSNFVMSVLDFVVDRFNIGELPNLPGCIIIEYLGRFDTINLVTNANIFLWNSFFFSEKKRTKH